MRFSIATQSADSYLQVIEWFQQAGPEAQADAEVHGFFAIVTVS